MFSYYLLQFLANAGIMILEIVAGRLIAPFLGVNLYTWTSIIGVVLAGMGIGSFVGGWLSDRREPRRLLGWVLMLASLTAASILPLLPLVPKLKVPEPFPAVLIVLVPVMVVFLVPAFFLGLISPIVYKLALRDLQRLGGTVGRLSAAGLVGSITGTFATGFWLVPNIGSRVTVLGVAIGMALLAFFYGRWRSGAAAVADLAEQVAASPQPESSGAMPLVPEDPANPGGDRLTGTAGRGGYMAILPLALAGVLALGAWQMPQYVRNYCQVESAYYCLRISWTSGEEDRSVKLLVLDHLIHSGADPLRPEFLWYDYEKAFAWIVQAWGKSDLHSLVLGGGGYSFPYWLEQHVPQGKVDVAEIDPAVTEMALQEFIPAITTVKTYNADARIVLGQLPPENRYDLVVSDAFNDVSVPYHLATVEFVRDIKSRMNPGGIYLVNVIDRPDGPFVSAMTRTLEQAFPVVYLLPGDRSWGGRGHSPQVLVATDRPLPWSEWRAKATQEMWAPELLTLPPGGIVLTDDYAPVDNLLLPIFRERMRR